MITVGEFFGGSAISPREARQTPGLIGGIGGGEAAGLSSVVLRIVFNAPDSE